MAGKEISVKKYVVKLRGEEREQLEVLIRKGKGPARSLLKAFRNDACSQDRFRSPLDSSKTASGCRYTRSNKHCRDPLSCLNRARRAAP
jgi:hypothetical protein